MADAVKMVVVDGIRYRPEDAPKREPKDAAEAKSRTPKNKARIAPNKEA